MVVRQLMVILRPSCFLAFGTITDNTPWFIDALTPSWSTRTGKLKERENSPMERSETQYFVFGSDSFGSALATSVDVFSAVSSSSTLALRLFVSPCSVIEPADLEDSIAGGVPEV